MNPETTSARLTARLNAASSVEDILKLLSELRGEPRTHPEAASLAALEERAFDSVRRLTDTEPDAAASVLRGELLPRCLEHDSRRRDTPWPSYAELFGEWLKELPIRHQIEVRSVALASAMTAFDTGNIPGGLRVVAQIGYAEIKIRLTLEKLFDGLDDELGDRVLAVRVSLGSPPKAREFLRWSLHERLQRRGTYRLFDVAKRIGDMRTSELILRRWLPSLAAGDARVDDLVALGALADISAREPDSAAATEVWQHLQDAARAPGGKLYRTLDMGVIARFATPHVIPNLLGRMPHDEGTGRWLTYNRLKECVDPRQLAGWDSVPPSLLDAAARDAIVNVADRGQFKTQNMRQKEDAWEVLLCVGRADLLPPISSAVARNASGHVAHGFLELAACLGLSPLPKIVPALIAGNPPDESWSQDELLVAQVGAIRTAHAVTSDQAFEALLRYRPVRDGILISVIDALADVARRGAASGDRRRIGTLLDSLFDESHNSTVRSAAGAALAKLLEAGALDPDESSQLADHAAAASVDPFTRRALLYAFAAHPEFLVPAGLFFLAEAITGGARRLTDEEQTAALAPAALMLYASRLDGDALIAFQTVRLGLSESSGRVHAADPAAVPVVGYHLIAHWYGSDPARYAPAMSVLLRTDDPRRTAPLAVAIQRVGTANLPEVLEALVTRLHRMDDGHVAEPFLLELLGEVAPDRLVKTDWSHLDRWLPQARAALADAVARVRADHLRIDCERLLIRLACDGMFGVRRAAFRAYSELAPDAFTALAVGWATAEDDGGIELRQRAAEAYRWVRSEDTVKSLRALEWDPEPSVREAFTRAADERREAAWADAYAAKVLSAAAPADVVRLWRYGSALVRLGDDQTISLLRTRAQEDVPPNVRFWLDRIRKAVQSRWDDVVRKWPGPWFTRRGRYEVVNAVIQWADGSEAAARTHLWFAATDQPDGFSSWGGWAELDESSLADSWKRAFGGTVGTGQDQLAVSGRPPADILVTRQFSGSGRLIVFSGNGPYPGDATEP